MKTFVNTFAVAPITDNRVSRTRESAVVDTAGMVWAHANPVELYRWISRRNDLLSTIAVAFPPKPRAHGYPDGGLTDPTRPEPGWSLSASGGNSSALGGTITAVPPPDFAVPRPHHAGRARSGAAQRPDAG